MKGPGADVASVRCDGWDLRGKGYGDAATSGANVEEVAGGALLRSASGGIGGSFDRFEDPFDQFLGLGSGDEDVFVDIEPPSGEPAFMEDILNGPVGEQLASVNVKLFQHGVRKWPGSIGEALETPLAGQMFHYPVSDQRCFAAAI